MRVSCLRRVGGPNLAEKLIVLSPCGAHKPLQVIQAALKPVYAYLKPFHLPHDSSPDRFDPAMPLVVGAASPEREEEVGLESGLRQEEEEHFEGWYRHEGVEDNIH